MTDTQQTNAPPGQSPVPVPAETGTAAEQTAAPEPSTGELVPRSQLSEVAPSITAEARGLASGDPALLFNIGVQRLLAASMVEANASASDLRQDLKDARAELKEANAQIAALRADLAVASSTIETEQRLRRPRAALSMGGLAVAGFGVDQFGGGKEALGIVLVLIGLILAVVCPYLVASAGRSRA